MLCGAHPLLLYYGVSGWDGERFYLAFFSELGMWCKHKNIRDNNRRSCWYTRALLLPDALVLYHSSTRLPLLDRLVMRCLLLRGALRTVAAIGEIDDLILTAALTPRPKQPPPVALFARTLSAAAAFLASRRRRRRRSSSSSRRGRCSRWVSRQRAQLLLPRAATTRASSSCCSCVRGQAP